MSLWHPLPTRLRRHPVSGGGECGMWYMYPVQAELHPPCLLQTSPFAPSSLALLTRKTCSCARVNNVSGPFLVRCGTRRQGPTCRGRTTRRPLHNTRLSHTAENAPSFSPCLIRLHSDLQAQKGHRAVMGLALAQRAPQTSSDWHAIPWEARSSSSRRSAGWTPGNRGWGWRSATAGTMG